MDSCSRCHAPIENYQTRVYAIQGYEKVRSGAGGHNQVLRKHRVDGYVWHEHCWDAVMRTNDGAGQQMGLT